MIEFRKTKFVEFFLKKFVGEVVTNVKLTIRCLDHLFVKLCLHYTN